MKEAEMGGKKSLEEMLIENGARPNASRSRKNYAAFMENWDEIRDCIEKGWSRKNIWETLHNAGIIDFSYPAFTNYIRKLEDRKRRMMGPAVPSPRRNLMPTDSAGKPISTKVDLPVFGENAPVRDPKRF